MNQQMDDFKWLRDNLELQLEDLEFERCGKKIVLYFDTGDVQPAVLGLRYYYDGKRFQKELFENPKTIVDCLIASGLLGKFSMLPPHLSEFYRKVDTQFKVGISRRWDYEALQFLQDVGLLDEDKDLLTVASEEEIRAEIKGMTKREVQRLAETEVNIAQRCFNAFNCLLPWQRRLKIWLDHGYLRLEDEAISYRKIIDSLSFKSLKEKFDARRPTPVNNFVDAAAVYHLLQLVSELNIGHSDVVPRFFIPPGKTFFQSIISSTGLDKDLICRTGDGKYASSIFRNVDYFIFRVTFRPLSNGGENHVQHPSRGAVLETDLLRLYEKIARVIEETKNLDEQKVRQYAKGLNDVYQGKSLPELITELRRFAYIEQNWLETRAAKELLDIIEQMKEVQKIVGKKRYIYEDERFRKIVLEGLKGQKKELNESLEEFAWVSRLWNPLYRSAASLRKRRQIFNENQRGDLFRDLGLLRYGFPTVAHKQIRSILEDLCSEEDESIRKGCVKAIKAYLQGRKDPREQQEKLIIAAAVLLAARLTHLLLQLLESTEQSLAHYSIKIAYAELLYRLVEQQDSSEALKVADNILFKLEKGYAGTQGGTDKAHLAVGLAYLCYRAWRVRKGDDVLYDLRPPADMPKQTDKIQKRALDSIAYARFAYEHLGNSDLSTKAYALNQYLYYTVASGQPISFSEHHPIARELFRYRFMPRVWQYRFDDTLARYYDRLADVVSDPKEREQMIELAVQHSKAAFDSSPDDEEVKTFWLYMKQRRVEYLQQFQPTPT